MLRRFNDLERIVFFKRDFDFYCINRDLQVYIQRGRDVIPIEQFNVNDEVYLKLDFGSGYVKLVNLINYAFKGAMHHAANELLYRQVSFIDSNPCNISPDNLYWNNTNALDDEENYRLIPGYSRYRINPDGKVKNILLQTFQSSYVDKYGYTFFGMTPDVGKRLPVGLHRLMAMSYLEIPNNFYELDVNHKDGVKSNCRIDNLEWSSRQWNVIHAYANGLRPENRTVFVRNVITDKVTVHYSIADSERAYGLGKNAAERRLKSKGQKVFPDFTQFCLKEDFKQWGKVNLDTLYTSSGIAQKIKVTNKLTGAISEYSSINECSSALGVKAGTLSFRLNRKPPVWEDSDFKFEKIIPKWSSLEVTLG